MLNCATLAGQVERDFNYIIENAVTFNFASDIVNKEAVRLFHACKNVFSKWARKNHVYCCTKCSDDHIPDDPNMQLLICDSCCEAIHSRCFFESEHAKLLYQEEGVHAFRQDQTWFCSVACFNSYQQVSSRFQLPRPRPPMRQIAVQHLHSERMTEQHQHSHQHQHQELQQGLSRQSAAPTLPTHPPSVRFDHTSISHVVQQQHAAQNQAPVPVARAGIGVSQPATTEQEIDAVMVHGKRPAPEQAADLGSQRTVVAQKRNETDSPTQIERGQGVRESLSLVQAMRAARNAEKEQQEQFQAAQRALQVVCVILFLQEMLVLTVLTNLEWVFLSTSILMRVGTWSGGLNDQQSKREPRDPHRRCECESFVRMCAVLPAKA